MIVSRLSRHEQMAKGDKVMGYEKLIAFAGGAVATGVLQAIAKQPAVRKATVGALAKGMQLKAEADEIMQDIKDEAEDACADARLQARIDAAVEARRAEIEERVRAEVEAEMELEAVSEGTSDAE